jgi:hypothetical protein
MEETPARRTPGPCAAFRARAVASPLLIRRIDFATGLRPAQGDSMRRLASTGRWLGMITTAATLASGVTTAQAADVYFGCFKNTTGKVRPSSVLVNTTPACKSTETLRSWNEQGPEGPQGAPGLTICHPEEFPGTAPANTFGVTNMFCATGHATGSGFLWTTPFDGSNNGDYYAFPRGDNFWTCVAYNNTASPSNYKCYLQCCS